MGGGDHFPLGDPDDNLPSSKKIIIRFIQINEEYIIIANNFNT